MTNQSKAAGRKSVKLILATVVAVLAILAMFSSSAFAGDYNGYQVTVMDNLSELTITTNETEPIRILNNAGITLATDDHLDLTAFEQGVGGTIKINRYSTINVEIDKNVQTYGVYSATVGDALKEIGAAVGEQDEVNYAMDAPVVDGMVITVKVAFPVVLNADGESLSFAVIRGTVADIISQAGLTLGADDYTEPALTAPLEAGMTINVFRVSYETEAIDEAIPYSTTTVEDDTLYEGTSRVDTAGVDGTKQVTYQVKYINGAEESREVLSETVTAEPVTEVKRIGTMQSSGADATPNGVTSLNGYSVGQVISGRYTHYCACATCNGNGNGVTTSGRRISNGMANPYYVACNWLPLGTVINVDGTNYTVVDRGGSGLSRVGRIDIFTPEGHSACYRYGTGSCTITIVRLGW
ncbi:MAG: G5 domain-containing protein [Eubacterium sp.]|nr:G5 domain-containing protein [Eubacterium sp.]